MVTQAPGGGAGGRGSREWRDMGAAGAAASVFTLHRGWSRGRRVGGEGGGESK